MSMINLKQYVLEKQAEWGREIEIKEIAAVSGVSRDTISRLMRDKPPVRVDQGTVNGLCKFFGVNRGEPIPFLIYDPE